MASMLTPSLQVAMNELSNHDHSRFLTRTNHIVGRAEHVGAKAAEEGVNCAVMREAVTVQMTRARSADRLLRRRGGSMRIYRSGQQAHISVGQGE